MPRLLSGTGAPLGLDAGSKSGNTEIHQCPEYDTARGVSGTERPQEPRTLIWRTHDARFSRILDQANSMISCKAPVRLPITNYQLLVSTTAGHFLHWQLLYKGPAPCERWRPWKLGPEVCKKAGWPSQWRAFLYGIKGHQSLGSQTDLGSRETNFVWNKKKRNVFGRVESLLTNGNLNWKEAGQRNRGCREPSHGQTAGHPSIRSPALCNIKVSLPQQQTLVTFLQDLSLEGDSHDCNSGRWKGHKCFSSSGSFYWRNWSIMSVKQQMQKGGQ